MQRHFHPHAGTPPNITGGRTRSAALKWLVPLMLSAAVQQAWALQTSQDGAPGQDGADGVAVGQAGQSGGPGSSVNLVGPPSADREQIVDATGGLGGRGGSGAAGSATLRGGQAGAGGAGGSGVSRLSISRAPYASVTASGGWGGDTGRPGGSGGAGVGLGAVGGAGGSATATIEGASANYGYVSVYALGGMGGDAYGAGGRGGVGGTALASGRVVNDTVGARLQSQAIGGHGGFGHEGADGGDGGAVQLINATEGSALSELELSQSAYGGPGGGSTLGLGGRGADAASVLSRVGLPDEGWTYSTTLQARGGDGGYSNASQGGAAGRARAALDLRHAADVEATLVATGGDAGDGAAGTPGAAAGAAEATAQVTSDRFVVISAEAVGGNAARDGASVLSNNIIWLGNGASARAQTDVQAVGVTTTATARGGQGLKSGDATAVANGSASEWALVTAVAHAPGANAQATATARETTTDSVSRGEALAQVQGATGLASATSTTRYTGDRALTMQSSAQMQATDGEAMAASSMGKVWEPAEAGRHQVHAALTGLPLGDLGLGPRLAEMAGISGAAVLAQGLVSFRNPASIDAALPSATAETRLQATVADGELAYVGLQDLSGFGDFGGLSFSIDNHGTSLLSRSFSTLDEARAFFTDHPIVLDGVEGDIDLGLRFVMTGMPIGGVRFNYVIGVIPEPSTQALMALAFGGLFAVRRWQRRSRASGTGGAA